MIYELKILFWLVMMLPVLFVLQAGILIATGGGQWGLGARDEKYDPSVLLGRAQRTATNHIEMLAIYAPLALIVAVNDLSSPLTQLGAMILLVARLLFVPTYYLGLPFVRTLIWGGGLIGMSMIAWEIFRSAV